MSDFKTQEVVEMSKIFHLKLLTEKTHVKILALIHYVEYANMDAKANA